MNQEKLDQIQEELVHIAKFKKLINVVSTDLHGFKYFWNINHDSGFVCDKSIAIENLDDAVTIIHNFSQEPKELIKANLEAIYEVNDGILYLHFTKSPLIS